ncbi:MAG: hypothetical protein K9N23_16265 [Akkermansiaceae bacterium]|nr:hypothetical protein [Akkermansiaceae bacterium]MCF7733246.1 hypothetical protein [Akkermansiaceae bacterium]
MNKLPSTAITATLIGAGAFAWALSARQLVTQPELATPLNPLGINRSPYGEVLAMAMQSPIDAYWHGAGVEEHEDEHECGPACDHDHDKDAVTPAVASAPPPLKSRLVTFLSEMDRGLNARNNPKPTTPAHQFYMRRQTEDKLRFAYHLDPAHYSNFNSYYFFLTQPMVGTRPELTSSAVQLAQSTIDYCLSQQDDPRPALTAASAAENILETMITDSRSGTHLHSIAQMRQNLALVNHCIGRFNEIAARWDASGNWNRLSEFRLNEIKERIHFICKMRDAQATAIDKLDQLPGTQQVSK